RLRFRENSSAGARWQRQRKRRRRQLPSRESAPPRPRSRQTCQAAAARDECYRAWLPYLASTRFTPSVTCAEDKVAPEIFLMSPPTLRGLLLVLPTNCASQPGSRTSPP